MTRFHRGEKQVNYRYVSRHRVGLHFDLTTKHALHSILFLTITRMHNLSIFVCQINLKYQKVSAYPFCINKFISDK